MNQVVNIQIYIRYTLNITNKHSNKAQSDADFKAFESLLSNRVDCQQL